MNILIQLVDKYIQAHIVDEEGVQEPVNKEMCKIISSLKNNKMISQQM